MTLGDDLKEGDMRSCKIALLLNILWPGSMDSRLTTTSALISDHSICRTPKNAPVGDLMLLLPWLACKSQLLIYSPGRLSPTPRHCGLGLGDLEQEATAHHPA